MIFQKHRQCLHVNVVCVFSVHLRAPSCVLLLFLHNSSSYVRVCVCVCVCACVRVCVRACVRKRERKREGEEERISV